MAPEDNPSRNSTRATSVQQARHIPAWIWLAAAVVVLLSVLTGLQTRRLQGELSRLNSQLREQRLRGLALEAERRRQEIVLAILSSPTTREFLLAPSDPSAAGPSRIRVFWHPEKGLLLVGSRLPRPAAGRAYQLWATAKDGTAVGCGTFLPDRDGNASLLTSSKVAPGEAQALWITEEAEPGSAQPGSAPLWKAKAR